jgi:hypothetical protein
MQMVNIKILCETQANYDTFTVNLAIIALKNSYMILATDQDEYGIGTLILSSPPSIEGTGAISSPFTLFGLKNNMIANLIGKTASKKLKKPVLTLLLIKEEQLKQEIIMKTIHDALLEAINKIPQENS